ncbi:DNA topoisomerase III [Paenibacillus sp. GSMTC-2017]|uniref:DNA topoisomerase III n=1 Tax=Paenibacillus sp. GSMTC-2017 TaxID=2794350 RepID=UPI0018D918CF|nr:DNA topoisomerase III [Paenibacillus sp. GSMTC-2017]MBH5319227.1 DNA topoisomerase III [Paenibacillus sp. GSMTC-2017]
MKVLVLAEKPSVAKEIARVLGCGAKQKSYFEGPKYVVTWALGHLVTLAEPEEYDKKFQTWNLEDLPLLPNKMNLKVMKETSHQFRAVSQLCKRNDIGELIIATDAGREGELVARWIMELVHWKKPFKRLWISSQTDQAIKDGFKSVKPGRDYDNLYTSAVCRAEADWLIGLNMTRALTVKYNAQLAAGRVQTPTLSMLMNRESEIGGFQSQPYWTIGANFSSFSAVWRQKDGHDGRLWSREEADKAAARAKAAGTAKVEQLRTSERAEPHPEAYDLTELQRDANKRLGFSAKQTSNVLQKLYEQHKLVTYPRTDSRHLTSDMVPTLKGRLESVAVGAYAPLARKVLRSGLQVTKRFVDNSRVTDHHAIIPTEQYVNLNALTNDERRLYDLIVRRFISLFYGPYRYDETNVTLLADGERFYTKGKIEKDIGWREVYQGNSGSLYNDTDEAGEGDAGNAGAARQSAQKLPSLQIGQLIPVKQTEVKELRTLPPARYTEATLLTQMEKHGLGTPATRADIIEKLIATDTIERMRNTLAPTGKGKQLIELVVDELRSPELTARWESELERIAQGKGDAEAFMRNIREQASKWVAEVKRETKEYKPHNLTGSICPDCSKPLLEVKGKRGKSLVCSDRECTYRRAAEPVLLNKRCPQCHKKMEMHTGKAGKYAQCRPCNVIEMLGDKDGGRMNRREQQKLVQQFSDSTPLANSLADKLKAALEKKSD